MTPMTRFSLENYPNRAAWLEARKRSLGGSDMGDLMGIEVDGHEPRGAWWLWVSRNPEAWRVIGAEGQARYQEIEQGFAKRLNFAARRAMEPVIEGWLSERIGRPIVDPGDFCIIRGGDPRQHFSPDGLIYRPDPQLEAAGLVRTGGSEGLETAAEYKTVSPFAQYLWGDEPSEHALYQVQWSLGITGWESMVVGAQVGFGDDAERDRLVYTVERSEELIGLLREIAEDFWRHVDRDEPPPVDGFAGTTNAIRLYLKGRPKTEKKMVFLGPEFHVKQQDYWSLRDERERIDRELARISQEVEVEMGREGATRAQVGDTTWYRSASPRERKHNCPDCQHEASGDRVYFQARRKKE